MATLDFIGTGAPVYLLDGVTPLDLLDGLPTGSAFGVATVSGVGAALATATGTASGASTVLGVGTQPPIDPALSDTHDGGASEEHIRHWRKLAKREEDKRKAREALERIVVEAPKPARRVVAKTEAAQPTKAQSPPPVDVEHLKKFAIDLKAMLETQAAADEDDIETILLLA